MLADGDYSSLIIWTGALIGVAVVFFLAVTAIRKWLKDDTPGNVGVGFSLSDLRQLVREGKMTNEEFEKAKAIILAAAHKPAPEKKSTDDPRF